MGGPKDNKKRKALSVDDLMRMQEQPSSKRFREDLQEDSAESDPASSSTSSISQSQERSDDSSNEDEGEEHSDISSSDDENDEISPNNLSLFDESTDRFSSSRISIVPRTTLPKAPINPPTTSTPRPTSFASFGISHALLTALSKMSIKAPTEIQAACIPPILEGEYNIL